MSDQTFWSAVARSFRQKSLTNISPFRPHLTFGQQGTVGVLRTLIADGCRKISYVIGVFFLLLHFNNFFLALEQQFPCPRIRPLLDSQTNVEYKIPCAN